MTSKRKIFSALGTCTRATTVRGETDHLQHGVNSHGTQWEKHIYKRNGKQNDSSFLNSDPRKERFGTWKVWKVHADVLSKLLENGLRQSTALSHEGRHAIHETREATRKDDAQKKGEGDTCGYKVKMSQPGGRRRAKLCKGCVQGDVLQTHVTMRRRIVQIKPKI